MTEKWVILAHSEWQVGLNCREFRKTEKQKSLFGDSVWHIWRVVVRAQNDKNSQNSENKNFSKIEGLKTKNN